jgi:hypothetical protein
MFCCRSDGVCSSKKFVYYYYEFISNVRLNRMFLEKKNAFPFKKVTLKKKNPLGNFYYFPSYEFWKAICRVGSFSEFIKMIIRLVGVRSLSTTAACAKVRIQEIRIFDEFLAHNKRQGAQGGKNSFKVYRKPKYELLLWCTVPYSLLFYFSRSFFIDKIGIFELFVLCGMFSLVLGFSFLQSCMSYPDFPYWFRGSKKTPDPGSATLNRLRV